MATETYWLSPLEDKCQTCDQPFGKLMYDMKTNMGPWANMCNDCALLGPGIGRLGTGLGQKYQKQSDGRWLKVAG